MVLVLLVVHQVNTPTKRGTGQCSNWRAAQLGCDHPPLRQFIADISGPGVARNTSATCRHVADDTWRFVTHLNLAVTRPPMQRY